jgi:aminocarboxymuconate-semialdehyde decarboxylase
LPYPEQIPTVMKEKKLFWLDADRKFMRQGNWKRPVTDPSFFLNEKLEWMEASNIDHEVVLNLSQLYANGLRRDLALDTIRFQNDFNAATQNEHKDKFTCGFVVQPLYIEDALKEIERCVNELDMKLLCLPTHFIDANGQWKSTAHQDVEPIWELANEYSLAVEIHPYDAPKMIHLEDQYWRFHLVWMCAQTADHYHIFTLRNLPAKYPNVRTCFAHGNQFGQMNVGRRKQGYEGRPDLFKDTIHPSDNYQSDNVFFDTLVHDVYSFRLLLDRQGSSRIVAGLDDPYPLGEMKGVGDCYPGKVIDEAVKMNFISKEERDEIWFGNVLAWLG